ncbi:MAG: N-acetyltransferase [Pseudomonadota bacterium]
MTSTDWKVRRVHPELDAETWRDARLDALRVAPTAFASLHSEWEKKPLREVSAWLNRANHFAAFAKGRALGIIAWSQIAYPAGRHRAQVLNVYVRPEARGQGIGDALIEAVVRHAEKHVLQLELGVTADNPAALALYQRHGFREIGRLPRGYHHADGFRDEILMLRPLDGPKDAAAQHP